MSARPVLRPAAAAALALAATLLPAWLGRGGGIEAALTGLQPTALRFPATEATFDAWTGEVVHRVFSVSNPTDRPVRFEATDATCGCVRAVARPRYLEAGASGTIEVTATLDGRYGPQHYRVRVRTDEGPRTGTLLTLRGEARALVRPEPWRWMPGPLDPGTTARARVALRWIGPAAAWQTSVRGDHLRVEARPDALDLRLDVPWESGSHFDGVLIRARPEGGDRIVETWIPVVWAVAPAFEVEPPVLELRGGTGAVTVRARWPGKVVLAGIDPGSLPLEVERAPGGDGTTGLRVVLTGSALDVPLDAELRLLPEPASMGVVTIPVVVRSGG